MVATRVLLLPPADPVSNLAFEEALFSSYDPLDTVFLVYRNTPSVIVGKFQNPWFELDVDAAGAEGIPVLRRISGGGTVYHDLGNLNYSFMGPRKTFDKFADLGLLSAALGNLGFESEANERGDLLIDGKKISGNAMAFKSQKVLHHGTLLVSADLSRLRRLMSNSHADSYSVSSAAVASKKAPVTSLGEIRPGTEPETIAELLCDSVSAALGGFRELPPAGESDPVPRFADSSLFLGALVQARNRYLDWAWNFGQSPQFTLRKDTASGPELLVDGGKFKEGPLDGLPFSWAVAEKFFSDRDRLPQAGIDI